MSFLTTDPRRDNHVSEYSPPPLSSREEQEMGNKQEVDGWIGIF